MNNNDFDIILNLRSLDPKVKNRTIESVYTTYYPLIRSMILNNSGSDKEAEDIFQDTMIVLYSKARNDDFELSCTLKTYMYSIARNLWLNKLKSKDRFKLKPIDEETIEIESHVTEVLEVSPKQKRIMQEFALIGEKCKEVLYNFYYHRMSMHSIAQEMGFANEQVAKNKKSRCLKKLKLFVLKESGNS